MGKVKKFFMRGRNIYLCIVVMVTCVTALASISFSFYVNESNDKGVSVEGIDNRISCDACKDNKVIINPQETIEITLYVMSNNDFKTDYELYYIADYPNVDVVSYDGMFKTIDAYDVHEVKLTLENYETREVIVELGIVSNYMGKEIEDLPGNKILKG